MKRARSFYPTCCGLFDDDEDYDDGCIYYENTSFFFANYTIPVKRFKSTYEFLLTKKSSLYTSSSKPPHKKPHKEQLKEIVALQHWMLNRLLSLLRLLSDPQYYGNVSNVLASKLALKIHDTKGIIRKEYKLASTYAKTGDSDGWQAILRTQFCRMKAILNEYIQLCCTTNCWLDTLLVDFPMNVYYQSVPWCYPEKEIFFTIQLMNEPIRLYHSFVSWMTLQFSSISMTDWETV